jgi:hypothetical protein
MRQIVRLIQVHVQMSSPPDLVGGLDESDTPRHLSGYVLNQPSGAPRSINKSWGYRIVEIIHSGVPEVHTSTSISSGHNRISAKILQLRPVWHLLPVRTSQPAQEALDVQQLKPLPSGQAYVITSPAALGLVNSMLAEALKTVFEQFAIDHGFTTEKPLKIHLSRGYKANSHGHKEGRAADIAAVGGKGILQWKHEWDRTLAIAEKLTDPEQRAEAIVAKQQRNLGYGLYKALQAHGGWRVNPGGWRVYHNVMQLFGPWTATEGPWKAIQIENPTPEERQRLVDQRWVFQAHQDHIHVAR